MCKAKQNTTRKLIAYQLNVQTTLPWMKDFLVFLTRNEKFFIPFTKVDDLSNPRHNNSLLFQPLVFWSQAKLDR